MSVRRSGSRIPIPPHRGPVSEQPGDVAGGKSGALRAAIFGVNDGLVSNLSLIMGVAGAGVDPDVILVAGTAGLLAGAFSMAGGEYISMRAQREVFERLIHIEAHEIGSDPDGEREELEQIYTSRGIPDRAAREAATAIHEDPELALGVHAREELGLDPEELGSPWGAGASSFVTFAIGAFIPLLPFLFSQGATAKWTAVALSLTALFSVGAAMTVITGRLWLWSGARMAMIGGTLAAVTFGIGSLLGVATS